MPYALLRVAAITAGPSGVTSDSPVSFEFSTESGSSSGGLQTGDCHGSLCGSTRSDEWGSLAALAAIPTYGCGPLHTSEPPLVLMPPARTHPTGVSFQCRMADGSGNITSDAHHDWRVGIHATHCLPPASHRADAWLMHHLGPEPATPSPPCLASCHAPCRTAPPRPCTPRWPTAPTSLPFAQM